MRSYGWITTLQIDPNGSRERMIVDDRRTPAGSAHRPRAQGSLGRLDRKAAPISQGVHWIAGDRSIFDVDNRTIEEFLDRRGLCAVTRRAWLSHLHSFYVWAINEDLTEVDPTVRIVRPKLRRRLPRPADSSDLRRALSVANPIMRCWILLAAYQGLRCCEIAGVRRDDITQDPPILRVIGKGDKERSIPLHPVVFEALQSLLCRVGLRLQEVPRRPLPTGGGEPGDQLFPPQHRDRFHGSPVSALVRHRALQRHAGPTSGPRGAWALQPGDDRSVHRSRHRRGI